MEKKLNSFMIFEDYNGKIKLEDIILLRVVTYY